LAAPLVRHTLDGFVARRPARPVALPGLSARLGAVWALASNHRRVRGVLAPRGGQSTGPSWTNRSVTAVSDSTAGWSRPVERTSLLAGTADGIVVSSSPPALAGLLCPAYRVVKLVLGVPAAYGRGDQRPSGPGPFAVPVSGDARVDVAQVVGHRLAGAAQVVDPIGQGIFGPHAAADHVRGFASARTSAHEVESGHGPRLSLLAVR
jgi:hypothetical protein